jgi:hypothetical protein
MHLLLHISEMKAIISLYSTNWLIFVRRNVFTMLYNWMFKYIRVNLSSETHEVVYFSIWISISYRHATAISVTELTVYQSTN